MRTRRFLLAAATAALMARGDVTLLSPVCGEVFHPLTDWQMKVFAGGTREARFEILNGVDEKATRKEWRRQRPLVLKWLLTVVTGVCDFKARLAQRPKRVWESKMMKNSVAIRTLLAQNGGRNDE